MTKSIGMILLCIFLVLFGLAALGLTITLMGVITGICAILAAVFLFIGK